MDLSEDSPTGQRVSSNGIVQISHTVIQAEGGVMDNWLLWLVILVVLVILVILAIWWFRRS